LQGRNERVTKALRTAPCTQASIQRVPSARADDHALPLNYRDQTDSDSVTSGGTALVT